MIDKTPLWSSMYIMTNACHTMYFQIVMADEHYELIRTASTSIVSQ